ncbi:class I SAM-dependent methyltransferase [Nocardiopsis halotolerans]|uniref:class I SAM-dependent methyltransferase n=1 Tax=Nocardiopsis halotolerans TaxID=124252 RepID=UPI00034904FB|nr:methyltransferase domain-containing protein [Nocardiopsis halotolerans]
MRARQKFDGLSDDYDLYRPRYPDEFFATIAAELTSFAEVTAVDTGAGTGIALEGLVPALDASTRYLAVDVSQDMVDRGRKKFPEVEWTVGGAEEFLEGLPQRVQLVVAAQAYQWMDRKRYVSACLTALAPGGLLAVMQNNRDHASSAFLDAYESLLEEHSPGYARGYRDFDIGSEIAAGFEPSGGRVDTRMVRWTRSVRVDDFVRMSSSSTQVQRAIFEEGEGFLDLVRDLCAEHARGGALNVAYTSELFLGVRG